MLRSALAAVALALVLAPPAQAAASTPTTLYFHVFDTFNAFPINTQPMDVAFFEVGGTSFPTASHTIVSQEAGDYDFNTIRGFATSGPVEYNFIENGRPRFHPERGIARTVEIDESVQPVAHLYVDVRDFLSSDTHPQNLTCTASCVEPADAVANQATSAWGGLPQAIPDLTFRFTMRDGNELGDTAALDAGQLIMSGQVTAHVVDTHALGANGVVAGQQGPDGRPVYVPDESGVVDFSIPLSLSAARITKADSFNVRIDWYQNPSESPDEDDSVSEGYLRLVSDRNHLPRLDMAIREPVYVEYVHPEVAAGVLLVHSCVNSPWGTYDVDVANITLAVTGPSEPKGLQQVVSQNAHVHGLHDRCAEVTYLWRFRDEGAQNGDYDLQLGVPNLAHTGTAAATAGFHLEGKKAYGLDESGKVVEPSRAEGGRDSPAVPFVALLAGLLALAWRRSK
jgi:hypothetical protein